jgi:ComEC/Rec2-related protein
VALAVGVVLGAAGLRPHVSATMVIVALSLAFVACWAALANGSRGRDGWLVAALWLAVLARGLDHGAEAHVPLREGHRGLAEGLRDLEVVGASMPGSRCQAIVRIAGSDVRWWVSLPAERCPLADGDRLRARTLVPSEGAPRPGAPDPGAIALGQGADRAAEVDEVWVSAAGTTLERWSFWAFVARQRQRAWEHGRGDDGRALVVATALGQRAALSPARRHELRVAGLGHLIAVSGLHVGLAAWLAFALLVRVFAALGGGLSLGVIAAVGSIAFYVVVTGGSASATRAGLMAALVAIGMLAGRPHHGLTTLVVACTIMVVVRPAWIADPGFQMSACAMAGLVGAPSGASALALTWRVTWAITPVSLAHFGTTSLWGLGANLVAIPIVSVWVLPLGLLAWPLSAWIGAVAWEPAAVGARVVLDVAAGLARLPSVPAWSLVVVAIAMIAAHRWARRVRGWPPLPFSIATLAAAVFVAWPRPHLELAWVADGSVHRSSVIAFARDGAEVRACVELPYGEPTSQLRTLEALGIGALGAVGPPGDPAARALEIAAAREGWRTGAGDCALPERSQVRAALKACARAGSGARGRAFAGVTEDGELHCFADGRWTMLLDSGDHDGRRR